MELDGEEVFATTTETGLPITAVGAEPDSVLLLAASGFPRTQGLENVFSNSGNPTWRGERRVFIHSLLLPCLVSPSLSVSAAPLSFFGEKKELWKQKLQLDVTHEQKWWHENLKIICISLFAIDLPFALSLSLSLSLFSPSRARAFSFIYKFECE